MVEAGPRGVEAGPPGQCPDAKVRWEVKAVGDLWPQRQLGFPGRLLEAHRANGFQQTKSAHLGSRSQQLGGLASQCVFMGLSSFHPRTSRQIHRPMSCVDAPAPSIRRQGVGDRQHLREGLRDAHRQSGTYIRVPRKLERRGERVSGFTALHFRALEVPPGGWGVIQSLRWNDPLEG